jgi:ribosomal subunit interface protein
MNYNLKGTGISITEENRSYVEKKLNALDKLVGHSARAEVELKFKPLWDGKRYYAEFMLHDPGHVGFLRAAERGDTLHEAIDLTLAELFSELTRAKRKKLNVFRRSAVKVKEYLRGLRGRP